ncbi:MAG TPA: hypothetical protein VNU68_23380 [Verrucomicrobiae bacterium]|nr:hypothetical protein [Verrucomicrobiae bacterium]
MKQLPVTVILCLLLPLLFPRPAHCALVLAESFDYANGPLTEVSAGRWVTHGGVSNQIQVVGQEVVLTQNDSEDVNALLANGPFRGPTLYAAFSVRFSRLPGGPGGYFAHFKDSTATGFRGRVYAATNGAAAGRFRLGIANGAGDAEFINADLELGQRYQLVLRYQTGAPDSTLWINPVGENSVRDRADALDATTATAITSFGLRQAQTASSGIGTLAFDSLKVGTSFAEVLDSYDPRLAPPALSRIPDQSIPADSSTPAVPFMVQDGETAADALLLTAVSDHPELVATSGVVFGGGGSNRTVTVTPTPGRQGGARVTVTVQDADGNTASGTFQVTVGVPSLSVIPDQVTPEGVATVPIPFSLGDAESDPLLIGVSSTNETLLPAGQIHLGGTGANRTLTLQPVPGHIGLSQVTIWVHDGFNAVSNRFLLTVFPTRGTLLTDSFNYPDGSLLTNSQFFWRTYGASAGDTGQTQVVRGQLILSSEQSEDLQAGLSDAPYEPSGIWVLYARFTLACSTRPSGSAEYFAHFRGVSSGSGARVFVTGNGAVPGKFRLGLSNSDSSPSIFLPTELETNRAYVVVLRFNTVTGQSSLWVNPTAETDPAIRATDEGSPFAVVNYAFRQSGGIGTLAVDDLRVGTSFAEVVPPIQRLSIRRTDSRAIEVSWPLAARTAGYFLQGTDDLSATLWEEYGDVEPTGDQIVVRFEPSSSSWFFRLAR